MKTDGLIQIKELVEKVNRLKDEMRALSDAELQDKTRQFKERLKAGEKLDALLPEAFAAVREADLRVLNMFPYDTQVLAGIVIHNGDIAAMKTGEGKSLAATMPLYLNALVGKGAILVTVNAYLANRDGKDIARVYTFMGLKVAIGVQPLAAKDFTPEEKRDIYNSDIIYTTSDKLGFDYLLEHLTSTKEDKYLRPYHYVVIDEADAILLDLAQMPLVISGAPRVQSNLYPLAEKFVSTLRKNVEYEYDESLGSVSLTEKGMEAARHFYSLDSLYNRDYFQLNRHVNLALRAMEIFMSMRDYMVMGGEIKLLSPITGRLLEGNKLQGGLHQAIETKEGVEITRENRAMASITYQNLFLMFDKISGMTGTAKGSEEELLKTYKTNVIEIPTYKPLIRKDEPDVILDTTEKKDKLIIDYVKQVHSTGQPIIITTSSVKNSAAFSEYLFEEGLSHNLLNALSEAKEAEIIREAGQKGSITVATLMAGRGTDIKLEDDVKELGGLVMVGTEKMPNRRIEEQIRGRAGRMGNPGLSKFYCSMEDDLFVRFGSIRQEDLGKKKLPESKKQHLLNRAQRANEDSASDARDLSMKFDTAMVKQRVIVYRERDRIIDGDNISDEKLAAIAGSVFDEALASMTEDRTDFFARFIFDNLTYHLQSEYYALDHNDNKAVKQFLMDTFSGEVQNKKKMLEEKNLYSRFQSLVFLKAIDEAWVEQADFLEQLKTVVQDRNIAQHKVEYEYRKEAFHAFQEMKSNINREVVRLLCLSEIETKDDGSLVIQYA